TRRVYQFRHTRGRPRRIEAALARDRSLCIESRPVAGTRPEAIDELVNAGDPRISPDGSRVAYVVTAVDRGSNEYRGAIWVAPLDGSSEPQQFTSGERRDAMPRWSPDGNWLAFASNRGGDEKAPLNLYV